MYDCSGRRGAELSSGGVTSQMYNVVTSPHLKIQNCFYVTHTVMSIIYNVVKQQHLNTSDIKTIIVLGETIVIMHVRDARVYVDIKYNFQLLYYSRIHDQCCCFIPLLDYVKSFTIKCLFEVLVRGIDCGFLRICAAQLVVLLGRRLRYIWCHQLVFDVMPMTPL